ncbi:MAG: ArnT family glycosyltransferase [Gammaproteobacteria bacterium]
MTSPEPSAAAPARDRLAALALVLLSLGVLFVDAAVKEVHGTAAFYASLARVIADTGDPLAPYRGADAYLLKPPLMLWLTAAAVHLLGPTHLAATLWTRLCGVAVVMLTWALGRRLYGPAVGWWAGLIVLTNSTIHQFSTTLRMDPMLTAGMLLALLGYFNGARRGGPALAFAGVAIAIMSKGPPALAVLLLAIGHALAAGKWPGRARGWLFGALVLVLPLAWYGHLYGEHGARVWTEFAADARRGEDEPSAAKLPSAVEEYVEKPLKRYWPWLPFMLIGYAGACRELVRRDRPRDERARAALLVAWVAVLVAGASIKPDHDVRYLYPVIPALAILAGGVLVRLTRARVPRPVHVACALAGAALLLAATAPQRWFRDTRPANAAMLARIDREMPPGAPVLVIGDNPNNPPGPRRQSTQYDWVHYYLGRWSVVKLPAQVTAGDLAAAPIVLVARHPRRDAILAQLNLAPVISGVEMVLALPPGRPGAS